MSTLSRRKSGSQKVGGTSMFEDKENKNSRKQSISAARRKTMDLSEITKSTMIESNLGQKSISTKARRRNTLTTQSVINNVVDESEQSSYLLSDDTHEESGLDSRISLNKSGLSLDISDYMTNDNDEPSVLQNISTELMNRIDGESNLQQSSSKGSVKRNWSIRSPASAGSKISMGRYSTNKSRSMSNTSAENATVDAASSVMKALLSGLDFDDSQSMGDLSVVSDISQDAKNIRRETVDPTSLKALMLGLDDSALGSVNTDESRMSICNSTSSRTSAPQSVTSVAAGYINSNSQTSSPNLIDFSSPVKAVNFVSGAVKSAGRRETLENGSAALQDLLNEIDVSEHSCDSADELHKMCILSDTSTMSARSSRDDRRNTADPIEMQALMLALEEENQETTAEPDSQSTPTVSTSRSVISKSSGKSTREKVSSATCSPARRSGGRQSRNASIDSSMNASVDGTKSLASSGVKLTTREQQEDPEENTTTSSMSSLQWAGISDHSTSAVSSVRSSLRRSPRRLTADATDLATLMKAMEDENDTDSNIDARDGLVGGFGRDSIESVNTIDLIGAVNDILVDIGASSSTQASRSRRSSASSRMSSSSNQSGRDSGRSRRVSNSSRLSDVSGLSDFSAPPSSEKSAVSNNRSKGSEIQEYESESSGILELSSSHSGTVTTSRSSDEFTFDLKRSPATSHSVSKLASTSSDLSDGTIDAGAVDALLNSAFDESAASIGSINTLNLVHAVHAVLSTDSDMTTETPPKIFDKGEKSSNRRSSRSSISSTPPSSVRSSPSAATVTPLSTDISLCSTGTGTLGHSETVQMDDADDITGATCATLNTVDTFALISDVQHVLEQANEICDLDTSTCDSTCSSFASFNDILGSFQIQQVVEDGVDVAETEKSKSESSPSRRLSLRKAASLAPSPYPASTPSPTGKRGRKATPAKISSRTSILSSPATSTGGRTPNISSTTPSPSVSRRSRGKSSQEPVTVSKSPPLCDNSEVAVSQESATTVTAPPGLRSCLSNRKTTSKALSTTKDKAGASGSQRKSIVFGSPKAMEFVRGSETTSFTRMPAKLAKDMFPITGATISDDSENEEEDALTAENSRILDEWDRLTNNNSEGSDDEFSLPLTPKSDSDCSYAFSTPENALPHSSKKGSRVSSSEKSRRRKSMLLTPQFDAVANDSESELLSEAHEQEQASEDVSSSLSSSFYSEPTGTVLLPSSLTELVQQNEADSECSFTGVYPTAGQDTSFTQDIQEVTGPLSKHLLTRHSQNKKHSFIASSEEDCTEVLETDLLTLVDKVGCSSFYKSNRLTDESTADESTTVDSSVHTSRSSIGSVFSKSSNENSIGALIGTDGLPASERIRGAVRVSDGSSGSVAMSTPVGANILHSAGSDSEVQSSGCRSIQSHFSEGTALSPLEAGENDISFTERSRVFLSTAQGEKFESGGSTVADESMVFDRDGETVQLEGHLVALMADLENEEKTETATIAAKRTTRPDTSLISEDATQQLETHLGAMLSHMNTRDSMDGFSLDGRFSLIPMPEGRFSLMNNATSKRTKKRITIGGGSNDVSVAEDSELDQTTETSESDENTLPLDDSIATRPNLEESMSAVDTNVNNSVLRDNTSLNAPSTLPTQAQVALLNRIRALNDNSRKIALSHCQTPVSGTSSRLSIGLRRQSVAQSVHKLNAALHTALKEVPAGHGNAPQEQVQAHIANADQKRVCISQSPSTTQVRRELSAVSNDDTEVEATDSAENVHVSLTELFESFDHILSQPHGQYVHSSHSFLKTMLDAQNLVAAEDNNNNTKKFVIGTTAQLLAAALDESASYDGVGQDTQKIWENASRETHSAVKKILRSKMQQGRAWAHECVKEAHAKFMTFEGSLLEIGTEAVLCRAESLRTQIEALRAAHQSSAIDTRAAEREKADAEMLEARLWNLRAEAHSARVHLENSRDKVITLGENFSALLEQKRLRLTAEAHGSSSHAVTVTVGSTNGLDLDLSSTNGLLDVEQAQLMCLVDTVKSDMLADKDCELNNLKLSIDTLNRISWTAITTFKSTGIGATVALTQSAQVKIFLSFCERKIDGTDELLLTVDSYTHEFTDAATAIDNNEVMLARAFYRSVLCSIGPLSQKYMQSVRTAKDVQPLLKRVSAFISALRYALSSLEEFAYQQWTWSLSPEVDGKMADASKKTDSVRISCGVGAGREHVLVIPLQVLISGNINALTAETCLRTLDGSAVEETFVQETDKILLALSTRFNTPFGPFPSSQLRQALENMFASLT